MKPSMTTARVPVTYVPISMQKQLAAKRHARGGKPYEQLFLQKSRFRLPRRERFVPDPCRASKPSYEMAVHDMTEFAQLGRILPELFVAFGHT